MRGGWFRLAAPLGGCVLIALWHDAQSYLAVAWPLVGLVVALGAMDWLLARKGR